MQPTKTIRLNGSEKDWKIMLQKVEKRRKQKEADTIIFGHTHIYHIRYDKYSIPRVINTGTFLDGDFRVLGKYILLSDAHIGTDNKSKHIAKKIKKLIEEKKDKRIILVGDIFELWTADPKKVFEQKEVKELLQAIRENKRRVIFIRGNHDYDIKEYVKDFRIYDDFYITYKDGKNKRIAYIYHGWEDDPLLDNILVRIWYYLWINIGDELYRLNQKLNKYKSKIVSLFARK